MDELITRYLAGETTPGEEKRLFAWIDEKPENANRFEKIRKVFELATAHLQTPAPDIDVDAEWGVFLESLQNKKVRRLAPNDALRPVPAWLKMAAAILVVVVSGVIVNYFRASDKRFESGSDILALTLPDSSSVTLNRYSSLEYAGSFGDRERAVTLNGQAFFQVKPDQNRRFVINTGEGTVEVVGTSFVVSAYDSASTVEVIVETGTVVFNVPSAGSVKLNAGNMATFEKGTSVLATRVNDDPNFRAWETGRLVFVNTPLSRVVETLNRTFNARISLSGTAAAGCAVTVTFDHQTLDAVLHVLESTLDIEIRRDGDSIQITAEGC